MEEKSWKFSELSYTRPNVAAMKKQFRAQIRAFETAPTFEAQRDAYQKLGRMMGEFESLVTTVHIRHDMNTADAFYEKEKAFWDRTLPTLLPIEKRATKALLGARFRKELEAAFGTYLFTSAEAQQRLNDLRLIPALMKESKLKTAYAKVAASCSVEFMGEKCNFYGLLKHMESRDRAVRKAAFEAWAKLYEDAAPQLDAIYDKLVALRVRMARTLGMDSYIEFAYLSRGRYDYTPADVRRFRESVKAHVVPAVAKLYEQQRARIGVDKLRCYDESFFYPDGNPDPIGTKDELVAAARRMYRELSPETGEFFDFMTEHELFDLETRQNKHLGGYCTAMYAHRAPFIFSNFNGTSADVDVLTHEAGHAFQAYLAMRLLPLTNQMQAPIEICEVHSMTMEHFTYPWMEQFFGEEGAKKYRYAHLQNALRTIPYLVAVDEFQHRVFENPKMSAEQRYAVWHEIEQAYMPWRDYDGNAFLEKGGFWMQKQHIFLYPFYYVDYALAQMGAFDFYLKMCTDRSAAWQDYLKLCRAGGSVGYFDLLRVGSMKNPFDADTVEQTVRAVMEKIENA